MHVLSLNIWQISYFYRTQMGKSSILTLPPSSFLNTYEVAQSSTSQVNLEGIKDHDPDFHSLCSWDSRRVTQCIKQEVLMTKY